MTNIQKNNCRGVIPKAVLYARFSSDNQREESIEAQLRAIREYCERKGIIILHEYCDRAKSATTDNRPEFLQMISDSKNDEFDFVIVHKLDRFSRNRYDSAYYKKELKKAGVSVLSVLENLDDSPESIILESVLEGMSEYYSKNLAREVMKGMRESALQCRALGGKPPYGYKINQVTHTYEINETEAEAVRLIYNRAVEGVGYSEIITELNRLGYKTGAGKTFGKNSLTEILRNEKYIGVYIFNRTISKNSDGKRNNHKSKINDDMIRIPGGMPAIVDELTFNRVAEIIKNRSHTAPAKHAKELYMLTGKIFCGECGAAYVGNRQFSGANKIKLVVYRCGNKNNYGDLHCTNKSVNQLYIESFVFKEVAKLVFNPDRIPQLIKTYYESSGEILGDSENKLKLLHSNFKAIQQKLDNIVNVISQTGSATLLSTLDKFEGEKSALELQIKEEEARLVANTLDEKEIVAAYKQAEKMFLDGSLPQRKQLLNLYIHRINVYPEQIEILLNNIPSSHLIPTKEEGILSADDDGQDALHKYCFELQKNKTATSKNEMTGLFLVEARGIEPLSENAFT